MTLHDASDRPPDTLPLFRTAAPPVELDPATAPRPLHSMILLSGHAPLDDEDLLALLLAGLDEPHRARGLARSLICAFRTVPRTLAAPPARLQRVPGIGPAHAAIIKAAEALATRHAKASLPDTFDPILNNYTAVVEYCRTLAGHRPTEELHVFYLDVRNRLIHDELHQHGTVNHTPLYPREVCVRALDTGATAIVIFHNHPSGQADPSRADISMTEKLRDALKLIEVTLHDHLIVTSSDVFSFRQKGLL